ncbi:MAG: hypothetical protein ACR2OL_13730 [Anderseniella sp.]
MNMNGIWKVEMLGPYGWESVATAFLEDGKYRAASENHYTVGNYEVSGNRVEISAVGMQHGKVHILFGEKKKEIDLKFEGKIEGDEVKGQARNDKGANHISFRTTRLADLP